MKRGLVLLLIIMASTIFMTLTVVAETNIAEQATVTASKKGDDSTSTPAAINDGVISSDGLGTTKWFVSNAVNSQWVQFTFETPVTLTGAKVFSGGTVAGVTDIAKDFKFQYDKEGEWIDVPGSETIDNEDSECRVEFSQMVTSSKFRYIPVSNQRFRIREIELYQGDLNAINDERIIICPEDVKNTKYESAVVKLMTLGLLENEGERFYAEYHITREEFVSWIINFIGVEPTPMIEKVFSDVESSRETAAEIYTAYRMGIVGKDGKTEFCPENEITYDEACVMIVSALGYSAKADNSAAYPLGYVKIASYMSLNAGIELRKDGYLSRGDCAILLANAMEQEMAVPAVYGKNISYKYGGNVLKECHNILKAEGIVGANEETSLDGSTIPKAGYIVLGGNTYRCGTSGASSMLGYNVELYYQERGNEKEVLFIQPSGENDVKEIQAKDLESTSFQGISYYKDGKKTYVALKSDTKFILNGAETGINELMLMPQYGRYVLIDNDGDHQYDVVFIHAQQITAVKSVNKSNHIIYGDGYEWKLDDFDKVLIYNSGKRIMVDDIEVGDVITVEQSGNHELFKCFVSRKRIKGMITEISDDKLAIDGVFYEILPECLRAVQVGQSGNFSVTEDGIIVDYILTESRFQFGLVIAVKPKVFLEDMQAKILCEDGIIRVYEIPKQTLINGEKMSEKSLMADQIIRFSVNSKGKINQIFAEVDANGREAVEKGENGVFRFEDAKNYFYKSGTLIDNQKRRNIILDNNTVVFKGPMNKEGADDSDYSAAKGTTAIADGRYGATFRVFNMNVENTPQVLYYTYTSKLLSLGANSATAIVKDVGYTLGETEEIVPMVGLYVNGKVIEYFGDEESRYHNEYNTFIDNKLNYISTKVSELKPGDVVQINADSDGRILSYRVLYKTADLGVTGLLQYTGGDGNQVSYYPSLETLSGTVYNLGDNSISFMADGQKYTYKNVACNVYIYNSDRKSVCKGNIADLVSEKTTGRGSRVFVRVNAKVIKDIVIYE